MPYGKPQKIKKNFSSITVSLASPEAVLERSYGEVLKPETINYRSFKPEKEGLFCEKIFGPVKDWECHCGKYKRIRYKGIICDRCGVEVTQKSVRRERMGHITLSVPVVHIWYFKTLPNKIGHLLGIRSKDLEKIIYYENYVVVNPGCAATLGVEEKQLLSEDEYFNILYQIREDNNRLEDDDADKFVAMIGGEAVEELLKRSDLMPLAQELRFQIKTETSQQRKGEALKRLAVVEAFRKANNRIENRPEWMVMRVVPVIPPELRPLVPLEGGRFATSDLNDLYRRVIIRNNRLKRLIDIKAPEVILRNEKRMLQEAVDSLFDNSRKANAVRSDSNRALKSLSDMLKGKQGRFRQNLLGKRVDYSGRSVIVVGPELKLHQCGLPKQMAVELFKPFVIRKLIERGIVKTVKSAKKVVDRRTSDVWDILEKVIQGRPVMLNRAPTLHRLGIQAFQPVLIEGKAIRLHPLVCTAFNADFDGDQMAVHVPLSHDAALEAQLLMLASHNILSPAHGGPIAVPTQDMVLGLYYMTKSHGGMFGSGMRFSSMSEARQAYDQDVVHLHAKVMVRLDDGTKMETTMGRILFNEVVPKGVGFINEVLTKKNLRGIIARVLKATGFPETSAFLDAIKELGFENATKAGLTFSIADIVIPDEKEILITNAQEEVEKARGNYGMGFITENERYNQVIDIWTRINNQVSDVLFNTLKEDRDGFNAVYMMADSGARGSKEQIRQLGGMRGLMAKPQKSLQGSAGEIIENPIISNFKEGLTVLEYFISTHGARKGLADTALKTADAGYLTRRLVDVAQDVTIRDTDCGTLRGIRISALKDNEDIVEPLADRIVGRVSVHDVEDPLTGDMLVEANELIDEEKARSISETSIEEVEIRSVLTCEARRGVCILCYGRNLGSNRMVEMGEAVGVVAAQSIGEPGTQLTLRTFHIGGTASRISADSTVQTKFAGKVTFENLRTVSWDSGEETKEVVLSRQGEIKIVDPDDGNRQLIAHLIPYGAEVLVSEGDMVEKGGVLAAWDPYNSVIMSEFTGTVALQNIIEGVTYREESDEQTGYKEKVIIDTRERSMPPAILVKGKDGTEREYPLPVRARIQVDAKDSVQAGRILVKIPRQSAKTRDITGGLPRVTELFEARTPTDPAKVSEIDGVVSFGGRKRGSQEVIVTSRDGTESKTYLVSMTKHMLVHENDFVHAGDPLSDGQVAPHDILAILGPRAVQEYLVNEIQEVYRLQGVTINDKHIECIVRQMMQKVKVIDAGDTTLLEDNNSDRLVLEEMNDALYDRFIVTDPGESGLIIGEVVDRRRLREVNSEMKRQDKKEVMVRETQPAVAEPVLLGITQAALATDSFISAASFQETTKVLTEASIAAKMDPLYGLKENVIVGHLIPAGTGQRRFKDIVVGSQKELTELQAAIGTDSAGDGAAKAVETP
ncbi:MAG: DNA-directed RNA polymerase subunit beta' [Bacteroidetes Order II. Incertae sedis bacterium]|nr:DNA-directed RNA polymerase subunit beta' [Bacteroidetes Order II. bacterium]MBT5250509.1 DNA-directed RNA polymerase subunit beta' [Bacteroidetes Order II. bacterium]MBT6423572.1 DNA-directed RNA polymerase subunit beta' [Bacteroidetes Order II. bacterium]MBT6581699.1 DNA-directed RNA polymerase subunit beta' [Bacteroidetes Order II. bacterium]MBT6599417.1 DNA-directed RNA polymerase subunit beta' [Bacteroidetes Order II. bacterium]